MCAIFVVRGAELVEMDEQPFAREADLQRYLAETPELLSAEAPEEERRRWLLVKREIGVPAREEGSSRWSLDHLFVDQDAIPTFVEVKRAVNTDIRRKVVGQMLDYAANASAHWDAGTLRTSFESRFANADAANEELAGFLEGEHDPEEFWDLVAANLDERRLRLVFAAERIPSELRSIVEFLNEQLLETEVIAIEIKQYAAPDGSGVNVVPKIIGDTQVARRAKRPSVQARRSRGSEEQLVAHIRAQLAAPLAERLLDLFKHAEERASRRTLGHGKNPSMTVWMGENEDPALDNPIALRFEGDSVSLLMRHFRGRREPEEMDRLVQLFRGLPGTSEALEDSRAKDYRSYARFPVERVLASDEALEEFKRILDSVTAPPSAAT